MTKADIADKIYEKFCYSRHFTKDQCTALTETVLVIIKNALETEGRLKISGFGNFEVREKNDRKGRNPQTGDAMTISSRKVLTFRASSILKDKINKTPVGKPSITPV